MEVNHEVIESAEANGSASDLDDLVRQRRRELALPEDGVLPLAQSVGMVMREVPKPEQLTEAQQQARDEVRRQMAQAAERQKRQDAWLRLVNQVGKRYSSADFGTFALDAKFADRQNAALEAVREYTSRLGEMAFEGRGLVLFGPAGCGKDHLAMAVCRRAILECAMSCRWVNGQQWYGTLRDAIDDDSQSESRISSGMVEPIVLVISDPLPPLASDGLKTHQSGWLYRVVDKRYSAGNKITIVTANIADDEEADNRIGAATWDRLCHGAWKIRCEWPSHRKPAKLVNCTT